MQITRRSFAGMCAALPPLAAGRIQMLSQPGQKLYDIFGVPLRTGSLYPGTENDAIAYREAGIIGQFRSAGIYAVDRGDIPIPSFLPHHSIPPVRNWPGPRIAWDCVGQPVSESLKQPHHIPLLIGCDCSIVVGTAQTLMHAGSRELHVLYIDGDFDDAAPQPHICNSAASFAVWLLTNASPFWAGPVLNHRRSQLSAGAFLRVRPAKRPIHCHSQKSGRAGSANPRPARSNEFHHRRIFSSISTSMY